MPGRDLANCRRSSPALAFALAFVFGAVANRVNFCTMGAITDVVNFGDWRRMRMWLLAIAVAIAGAAALQAAGLDRPRRRRSTPARRSPWLSHLVGGFLFGFGMTLASGCGSKTLIRVGAGNLKSLVVLVFLAHRRVHDAEGRCSRRGARTALDPFRFDVGAGPTSDLPHARRRRWALGAAAKLWLPFVVAAAIAVLRVRQPRFPHDAAS